MSYFRTRLERLTKGKRDAPLVFFCLRDCWMSWNAAKRAVEAGYTNVMWFRDGTDGWQELGYPLVDVQGSLKATLKPHRPSSPARGRPSVRSRGLSSSSARGSAWRCRTTRCSIKPGISQAIVRFCWRSWKMRAFQL